MKARLATRSVTLPLLKLEIDRKFNAAGGLVWAEKMFIGTQPGSAPAAQTGPLGPATAFSDWPMRVVPKLPLCLLLVSTSSCR